MLKLPATCSESLQALSSARRGLPGLLTLSFVIALFPVATLLFLLLIFDVAIPGRSGATLTGLFFLYIAVLAVFFVLGTLRRRMLAHIGSRSCSTQLGLGKCCRNSTVARPITSPRTDNSNAVEPVVP